MDISMRSMVMAGTSAVAATAIALSPVMVPPPAQEIRVAANTQLAAATFQHLSQRQVFSTQVDLRQVAAALNLPEATVGASATNATTLNAAGDGISAFYQWALGWANYGVDLANYVLQFIPFGGQISAQINIVYDNLVVPIANSVVYGLIIPVVNAPLNPASYINGVLNVGGATVVGLINAGIAEFNHFFGWLIPPIPPIFSTVATAETLTTDALTATSDVAAVPPLARKVLAPLRAIADAFDSDLGVQPDAADGVPKLSRFAERRAARAEAFAESPGAAVRGMVRAQGTVTRSLVKAAVDAVTAAGADRTPKLGVTGISKAPSTAAKGLNDEAKKTIKGIQKVAKDVRKAVKAARDGAQG